MKEGPSGIPSSNKRRKKGSRKNVSADHKDHCNEEGGNSTKNSSERGDTACWERKRNGISRQSTRKYDYVPTEEARRHRKKRLRRTNRADYLIKGAPRRGMIRGLVKKNQLKEEVVQKTLHK